MTASKLAPHTEEILSMYDSGNSITAISNHFGTYPQPVTNILKKFRTLTSKAGTIDATYFSKIDTHLKAYFVGFISGDGALVKATNSSSITLTITLNDRDEYILEKLREELSMSRPLWKFVSQGRFNHVRLVTSNKQIVSDLMKLGIGFRKSLTMPDLLPNIPEEFRNSFILGLFDADGSCTVRDATWFDKARNKSYTGIRHAVQFRLTMDMCVSVVKQLGIASYHISTHDSIPNLIIGSKSEFIKFFNLIYKDCPFYLVRKYNKFLPIVSQDQTISSSSTLEELGARVPIIA